MIVLLGLATLLNYADRGSLSTAAPVLTVGFGLDGKHMGLLLSAFFWTYALAQPLAGWVAQRYPTRVVLAVGVATWSVATIACGLAVGFASLFALRLVLGLGEAVIFPATAQIIADRAREDQRGKANAVSMMGLALGPTLGVIVGAQILATWGWRAVFVTLGAVSLLWLIPWLLYRKTAAPDRHDEPVIPVSYALLLREPRLWGACLGQFCYAYPAYMLLTWLPLYLTQQQHLSLTGMGWASGAIYLIQAGMALASGVGSDAAIRRGISLTVARQAPLVGGLTIAIVGLLIAGTRTGDGALVGVTLMAGGIGLCQSMIFTVGQNLAGRRAAGRWMGIQNMAGNFAGVVAPIVTGALVDATGDFLAAFVAAAAFAFAAVASWLWLVGPVSELSWELA
ncbi:MFS transporter [uncultured Sphingomonas sp.]|uniref:MFS transporter n=1 Tax=uncultured Sphingomonas sp. TaxID=158754 RepID=UPI0026059F36|nr:MFS transporter [uncultured Sphingomonas sp.]